jgi:hypothetical protein
VVRDVIASLLLKVHKNINLAWISRYCFLCDILSFNIPFSEKSSEGKGEREVEVLHTRFTIGELDKTTKVFGTV